MAPKTKNGGKFKLKKKEMASKFKGEKNGKFQ